MTNTFKLIEFNVNEDICQTSTSTSSINSDANGSILHTTLSSRSRSSSECSETIEDLIKAAKSVCSRNVAEELKNEREKDCMQDQTPATGPPIQIDAVANVPVKRPLLVSQQNDSHSDISSPTSKKRPKIQQKQGDLATPSTSSSEQQTSSSSQRSDSTKTANAPKRKIKIDEQQALLLCQFQIPTYRLVDFKFVNQLKIKHSQFEDPFDRTHLEGLIDKFEKKAKDAVHKATKLINKFTLMLNAVTSNETIFIFISIAYFSRSNGRIKMIYLGMDKSKQNLMHSYRYIKPMIERVLEKYHLSHSHINCIVHSGFGDLQFQSKLIPCLPSYHDQLKDAIAGVFESSSVVFHIENTLMEMVGTFCQNESANEEFKQKTGIQLNIKEMTFDQLDEVLRKHRQSFIDIIQKHFDDSFKSRNANIYEILDELKRLKDLCQSQLHPTFNGNILTVDYVYPLLQKFLEALKTNFKRLERVTSQLVTRVQNALSFILGGRHSNHLYLDATAMNNQLFNHILVESKSWKTVLKKQLYICYYNSLSLGDKRPNDREFADAKKFANKFFFEHENNIGACFDSQIEANDEVNINYNAISFWKQFKDKHLDQMSANLLQIVPITIISTSTLNEMISDWISNQDTYPNNSFITNDDLVTIDRNCFVYFNQRFLF